MTSIFIKILNMSITASYVIVIIMAVRFFLKNFPKKYSYYLWGIVGLRLIFPFSATSVLSFFNLSTFTNVNMGVSTAEYIPSDIEFADTPAIDVGIGYVNESVNTILPKAEITAGVNPIQVWIFIASVIWVMGMLAILGYEIFLFFKTKNLVKKAVFYKDNIYECDNIPTPFTAGFIKPKIYIPFRLTEPELSYILCHEKYHIKRFDNIIKAFSSIIVMVYWFNPFIWMAYICMNRDMEMSCDEKVVSEIGSNMAKDYGKTLLSFALNKRHISFGSLAFGESFVSKRIKNILNFKKPKIWISIFGVFAVILIGAVCLTNGNSVTPKLEIGSEITDSSGILKSIPLPAGGTNFILAGTDETSMFTDTIIVGCLDGKNNLNLISVPRDTYVNFTNEQKEIIKEMGIDVPHAVKFSQINAYGGEKYGMRILKEQAENLLGIKIDYCFKINLEGLRNIVDLAGGIYFDVPGNGMFYTDPVQDLNIDIKGGYQLLDGNSAEGLLRFRQGYPKQDLQRTDVSREFIKEFVSQVIERDAEKNNLISIIDNCMNHVETDLQLSYVPEYIGVIKNIKNFNGEILPGSYQSIDGTVYYIPDDMETKKIADTFFRK